MKFVILEKACYTHAPLPNAIFLVPCIGKNYKTFSTLVLNTADHLGVVWIITQLGVAATAADSAPEEVAALKPVSRLRPPPSPKVQSDSSVQQIPAWFETQNQQRDEPS